MISEYQIAQEQQRHQALWSRKPQQVAGGERLLAEGVAVGVLGAGGAVVISCAHILYICRMSYFLASERSAVFLAAQTANAEYLRFNPNQH